MTGGIELQGPGIAQGACVRSCDPPGAIDADGRVSGKVVMAEVTGV